MQTAPAFAANPIGTQFDPDKLVAALAAAEDPATVYRRAYAGAYAPARPAHLGR